MLADYLRPAISAEELAAVPVPEWFERMLREDGHDERLAGVLRSMYRASVIRSRGNNPAETPESLALREMESMGVPLDILDNLRAGVVQDTQAMRAAADWWEGGGLERGRCLVLSGDSGIGKSYAAAWLAYHMLRSGVRVAWWYAPALFSELPQGGLSTAAPTVANVLVVDDLGAEDDRSARAKLDMLVYYRHARRAATIVTTNLDAQGIARAYGQRAADRLAGWGHVVRVTGASLRRAV